MKSAKIFEAGVFRFKLDKVSDEHDSYYYRRVQGKFKDDNAGNEKFPLFNHEQSMLKQRGKFKIAW